MKLPRLFSGLLCAALSFPNAGFAKPSKTSSYRGGMDGGGGIGVLCDSKLRVLDIYEAAEVHKWTLEKPQPSLILGLQRVALKINEYTSEKRPPQDKMHVIKAVEETMDDFLRELKPRIKYVRPNSLSLTKDASLPQLPPNCSPVQIAFWDSKGKILIDRKFWKMLDPQNRSALLTHELIYYIARTNGSKNSDESRFLTAMLFAENQLQPKFEPLWNAKSGLDCYGGGGMGFGSGVDLQGKVRPLENWWSVPSYSFYVIDEVRDGVAGVAMYFNEIDGYGPLTRTSAFVPGQSIVKLKDGNFKISASARNAFVTQPWEFVFESPGLAYVPAFGESFRSDYQIQAAGAPRAFGTKPVTRLTCEELKK